MKENILFDAVPCRTVSRLAQEIKTNWLLKCKIIDSDHYPLCKKIIIYEIPPKTISSLRWYVRGFLDSDWYAHNKKHIPR